MDVKPEQLFTDMAVRIERTPAGEFAGAAVIVPPNGDPIIVVMTDPSQHIVSFYSMIKSRVEEEVAKVMEAARDQQPGGWQRR